MQISVNGDMDSWRVWSGCPMVWWRYYSGGINGVMDFMGIRDVNNCFFVVIKWVIETE